MSDNEKDRWNVTEYMSCQIVEYKASWGDSRTCLACSHLFRGRLPSSQTPATNQIIYSGDIISKEIEGHKVTISLMMDKHCDATELAGRKQ